MPVDIVFMNALGLISPDIVDEVRAGIDDAVSIFSHHTPVENIGVSIHDSGFVPEQTGFGGISYGPQSFALYVDPFCEATRVRPRHNAGATAAHEIHHCLRQRSCPLRPYSQMCAGDVLVLEGLAVRCEAFLGYGEAIAVNGVEIERVLPLINRIAPDIENPKANWSWIYDQNGLAHSALYAMGYYIVAPYLSANRSDPIAAMHVPWREFWTAFQNSHR